MVKKQKLFVTAALCMLVICLVCAGCAFLGDNAEPTQPQLSATEAPTQPEAPTSPTEPQETEPSTETPTEPTEQEETEPPTEAADPLFFELFGYSALQVMHSEQKMYSITAQHTIARCEEDGSQVAVLYTGVNELRFLNCDGHMLYFMDGDKIMEVDGETGEARELLEKRNIVDMYQWENGVVYYTVQKESHAQQFAYDIATGKVTVVKE